ncbi:hypothetical protein PMAYCL1PPCAC_32618 [Pristionchus mayeri]|uniref:F-box domain-containing protein n=1 Tax=Pristionchus mayeri TaxID=1317129 RepID=A0AAN5DFS7_9BILA|nr:hypothetical protein PMAYCL1PPCAC_32618 [Pristionchus mayeri]
MISVTVAAQGKSKRLVGGHLKAYGSGRLSILDLNGPTYTGKHKNREVNIWARAFSKFFDVLYSVLLSCFPFVFNFLNSPASAEADQEESYGLLKKRNKRSTSLVKYSAMQKLDDASLGLIFSYLHPQEIARCESVCRKWRRAVDTSIEDLPKIQKDQIRLLFDEGEVVIYPVDEKRCPTRYPMPSLQVLARKLRHLSCLSLFVRGLIPVESTPVLKALCELSLSPQQIYFIWCKLSPDSATHLADFLHRNVVSLTDLGVEECTPGCIFTDALLQPLLPSLVSLRLWNDGKGALFAISDTTVLGLADAIREGASLETVDLACSSSVTPSGVVALIEAWILAASSDLSLSLSHCPLVTPDSLLTLLATKSIFFKNGKLLRRGRSLSLFL